MANVLVSPRADLDLAEIWAYIADDNESAADDLLALIETKFQELARRPRLGRLRSEFAEDIRSFPIGKYVIFYLPIAHGIEVVRVLHGARDITSLFQRAE